MSIRNRVAGDFRQIGNRDNRALFQPYFLKKVVELELYICYRYRW